MSFHSEPRYTKDLDLLLVGSDDNPARAAEALAAFGAPRSVIDLLLALGPEELNAADAPPSRGRWSRTGAVPPCDFSREVIASKRAAGRPRDLQDVLALERART